MRIYSGVFKANDGTVACTPVAKERSRFSVENSAEQNICLFLLSEESLDLGGGGGLDLLSRPVVLGLGHSVSKVDVLGPSLLGVGSTLGVEGSVIFENTGLGNISLVVGLLLGGFLLAQGGVGRSGQSLRDIRLVGDLTDLQVLLASGSVGVLVGLRGEEIHVGDLVEERFVELTSGTSLGGRGETLDGSNKDERENDGVGLHGGNFRVRVDEIKIVRKKGRSESTSR